MKRWKLAQGLTAALVTALMACGGAMMQPTDADGGATAGGAPSAGGSAGGALAGGGTALAGGTAVAGGTAGGMMLAAAYPSWQLVDVQPRSPRANQSYGLSVFQGQPLVVVLIEGF